MLNEQGDKMNRMTRRVLLASALPALALDGIEAHADQQPVRILVGFAPGGTTDVLARQVALLLGTRTGRSVIVENKAGASGNVAAVQVAKAQADGTTLLFVPSSHATNATLYKKLPFDTEKDFAAIGLVATTPYVLVVHPSVPARNVAELVALLKAHPGTLQYASAGQGTGQHLSGELFKKLAGVEMTQVPYKGSAAALPDLLAGRVPVMFDNVAVMTPHIRAGAVRALAVTSSSRSALLPEVPAVAQTLPGFDVQGWFALLAPAKTPPDVVQELNAALDSVTRDPSFRARLKELGAEPMGGSASAADKFVRQEVERWGNVIREAKITLD
jgi:tripartite-type tricarboxylate transporter receptor subunit TctC